jgi:hypothetical protein
VSSRWDELEAAFDKRLNSAVSRLGVPSRDEVKALNAKVDELTKLISTLKGAKAPVKAAPKVAVKPIVKPAVAKPAAKSSPAKVKAPVAAKAPAKPKAPAKQRTTAAKPQAAPGKIDATAPAAPAAISPVTSAEKPANS